MSAQGHVRQLPDRIEVGRVRKPHGVRGEVAVASESDVADRFAPGRPLIALLSSGEERRVEIATSRRHGEVWLIRFVGFDDRDTAGLLRSAVLEVERAEVPPPPDGSYYFYELAGCSCVDRAGRDLGRVASVIEDGGGLLLELETPAGRLLIPFVSAYLVSVDVAGGRIELDLPPGLVETCTSTS